MEGIKQRIEELIKFRIQLRSEIMETKERLEVLEANMHAANGGIAELQRLTKGAADGG